MIPDPLHHIERTTRGVNDYMQARSQSVLSRYPLMFSLLAAFGVAMVLYGFEHVLDGTVLQEHPLLALLIGLAILIFTGSLYKRLEKKID